MKLNDKPPIDKSDESDFELAGPGEAQSVTDPVTPAEDLLEKTEPIRTHEGDPRTHERIHIPPTS